MLIHRSERLWLAPTFMRALLPGQTWSTAAFALDLPQQTGERTGTMEDLQPKLRHL